MLSLIAQPFDDEFLSSWLDRTAILHGLQRHHLLDWSSYTGAVKQGIDDAIGSREFELDDVTKRGGRIGVAGR